MTLAEWRWRLCQSIVCLCTYRKFKHKLISFWKDYQTHWCCNLTYQKCEYLFKCKHYQSIMLTFIIRNFLKIVKFEIFVSPIYLTEFKCILKQLCVYCTCKLIGYIQCIRLDDRLNILALVLTNIERIILTKERLPIILCRPLNLHNHFPVVVC